MSSTLHISLLGDFRLIWGETPVTTITVPRVQSLLAYLILHHEAPQDRAQLAFLFWPESTEAQAHTNLRQLVHHLRRLLPDADQFLSVEKRQLCWRPASVTAPWTLDLLELQQSLAQAAEKEQAQDTPTLRKALERVMALYRGPLLSNCYEEWVLPEREHWQQIFLQAAERLITLLEAERAYDDAIRAAHHLLRQDALHEATYRHLMCLHTLCGDRVAALRVYHRCASVLERELGTEPGELTRAAYDSLMMSGPGSPASKAPLERGVMPPLLGRNAVWRRLQGLWRSGAAGRPQIALLSGEAGIGKTRLVEELEAWVRRQGLVTASAQCFAAQSQLAYAPVAAWLRSEALQPALATLDLPWLTEVARLVPEALVKRPNVRRPAPMRENWQRQSFFEALARALLAAPEPLLLLLDDLHWCDQETLGWLHYLFCFAPEAHLLLVGTVRVGELLLGHPLLASLSALQRDGLVTEIPVGPLTSTETASLAEHLLGHALDPMSLQTLYQESEGNPLFVVELVRAGSLEPGARTPGDATHPRPLLSHPASPLPPTVQSMLATRLAQLSPLAETLVQVAAVIGREFPFPLLLHACGEGEERAVRGLDELWQRRIVREQSVGTVGTYNFSHEKLREYVYATLAPATRCLLHRRVAEAFTAISGDDLETLSGQVAAHYERAGLPELAIPYYQRAGEACLRIYAQAEARHAFERAAALLEGITPGEVRQGVPWEVAAGVYESLGDVVLEGGSYQEARHAYQRALTYAAGKEDLPVSADHARGGAHQRPGLLEDQLLCQARLSRKLARSWRYVSAHPEDPFHIQARQAFQDAERLLETASDPSSPAWRHEWIELQFAQIWQTWPLRGSEEDMLRAIEKAESVVERAGTEEQRELLTYARAVRDLIRARYVLSLSASQMENRRAALATLEQAGEKSRIGRGHFGFGVALLWSGHFDEAEHHLSVALQMGEQIGSTVLQMRCLTFLPFIYRRWGQVEEVRRLLGQAQSIGALQNNPLLLGHRAWLARRDGHLAEAVDDGQASVEEGPSPRSLTPLQWVGGWPLFGVAVGQRQWAEAMTLARRLLDPTQQPPCEPVGPLLEAAVRAWDAGEPEQAKTLLHQTASLAEQIGYL